MWIVIAGQYKYGPFRNPVAADKWAGKNLMGPYVLEKLRGP